MDKEKELQFLENYIKETGAGFYFQYLCWQQLQALWTAYCFHHDVMVDTAEYDRQAQKMYDMIEKLLKENNYDIKYASFPSYEKFDLYMGMLLA